MIVILHSLEDKNTGNDRLSFTYFLLLVRVSFYLINDVVDEVSWIPNKHYSGIYGLLKLTLPKILPKHLEKTIVLDTDVTLANDISKV